MYFLAIMCVALAGGVISLSLKLREAIDKLEANSTILESAITRIEGLEDNLVIQVDEIFELQREVEQLKEDN